MSKIENMVAVPAFFESEVGIAEKQQRMEGYFISFDGAEFQWIEDSGSDLIFRGYESSVVIPDRDFGRNRSGEDKGVDDQDKKRKIEVFHYSRLKETVTGA